MKNTVTQSASQFDNLPATWKLVPFSIVLKDTTSGNLKIQQADYLAHGDLPIVDQGKELVAGFYDDENATYSGKLPAIIFGDHTRHLKFIDFPFALGADGVKVLTSASGTHPKYLFYFLQSVKIPNTGYNRHFKYLKELTFPLPPLAEQIHIAQVLDQADRLRQQDRQLLAHYDQLVQAVFMDMFGDPVRNEKGWPCGEVDDNCEKIVVGYVGPCEQFYTDSSGVPLIRTGNIRESFLDLTSLKYVTKAFHVKQKKSQVKPGDILIARHGDNGKAAIVESNIGEANCLNIVLVRPDKSIYRPVVLQSIFNSDSVRNQSKGQSAGATQKVINTKQIQKLVFPVPPIELQIKFEEIAGQILSQKAVTQQLQAQSEALFNSLLQQAFRGELTRPQPAARPAAGQLSFSM